MKRYKCTIAYDGARFSGFQNQPNTRTVQRELEAALSKMHKGVSVPVVASGRTDAQVHAKGQVIHFDSPLKIDPENWKDALNRYVPDDISLLHIEVVPDDFHARFGATRKEYRYVLRLSKVKDPFTRLYQYRYPYTLQVDEMEKASKYFIGTHDFTSFCSTKAVVKNKVRTIEEITFDRTDDVLVIRFIGTGFLYNMVRIIVGTLLDVGSGRRTADAMEDILLACDRQAAGKTAPPHGLCLWEVFYD